MGEIAESMLDGTLCQSCGEFIGDPVGYPRDCAGCNPVAESQTRRARNRQGSLEMLLDAGYKPDVKNNGAHLVLRHGGTRFDLWPGTGKWVENLNHKAQRRSVRTLLRRLKEIA